MKKGKRGVIGIVLGFSPWIAWMVLVGQGRPAMGLVLGFLLGGLLLAWEWRGKRIKAMELASTGFFAALLILEEVIGWHGLDRLTLVLLYASLATMAWTTLALGTPFTLQYAREDWPKELWNQPLFRSTNTMLTQLWAVLFTASTTLAAMAAWDTSLPLWLFGVVLPHACTAFGFAASALVPKVYPRWALNRQLAAQAPPAWSAQFDEQRPAEPNRHDVVVVGAGIGGLSAAALLAQRGLKVLVVDHHYLPGGFCTSWQRYVGRGAQRQTYTFDAGVHDVSGLGPNGPVRWLLRRLNLESRIEWLHMTHEYLLPELHLKVPRNARDYEDQLAARFPDQRDGLRAFFGEMEAVYRELYQDAPRTGGVPFRPSTADEMLAYPKEHPHAIRWMEVPFGAALNQFITDPALRRILSALSGYLTDAPERLTVGAMAPIFGYYFDGGYYPKGGSQRYADALVGAIEERGGEVRLRTAVKRILVENGRATGVELADGRLERASAVVSNADLKRTFGDLIAPEQVPATLRDQVKRLGTSASALYVTLGLDYVPDLEAIAMVESEVGKVGIANPSKVDATLAPAGHSALVIVSLTPANLGSDWDRHMPEYRNRKREACDRLIACAEHALPGLRDHIVYRQDGSPATVARYAWTTGGSIYGPALGDRPQAKTPIEGLVLAGAGVFPGAGVEAVTISGMIAADLVAPHPVRAEVKTEPLSRTHTHPEAEEAAEPMPLAG